MGSAARQVTGDAGPVQMQKGVKYALLGDCALSGYARTKPRRTCTRTPLGALNTANIGDHSVVRATVLYYRALGSCFGIGAIECLAVTLRRSDPHGPFSALETALPTAVTRVLG
jgi:phosphatidylglycerophosphatase A